AFNLKVFEGEGIIFSQSYDNTEGTALEPDNWAVSPAFDLSEATGTAYVTLYARGQDDSYAEEVFQIYAGTTPDIEEMDPISEEFTATDEYEQYRGNLTDFIGEETVYVAIRHYDVTDMFYLNVDAVEIWAPSADDVFLPIDMALTPYYNTIHAGETVQLKLSVYPDYAMGYEVTYEISDKEVVDLDPDTGIVTGLKEGRVTITAYITDTELSSEVVVTVLPPLGDLVAGFYFEDEDEVEEWTFIDDDEDGNNWIWSLTDAQPFDAYEGEGIIYSNSYINDVGAVTPDNWAITPAIELPEGISTVTLWAKGQDADWCEEIFAIYAGTTPDIDDMEQVSEIYIASDEYERYEADLSDFAGGTVYVAIRHFEVTDQYILDVDCVEIWCNGNIASVDTAEIAGTYVAEYNMPLPGYENIKMGDLNGNGEVDASDYLKVKRNVLGTYDLNDTEFLAADIDFNGTIEASDYLKIKRKVLGTYELPEVPSITQEYSLRVKGDGTATMLVSSADDEDLKGYAYIIPITIEPAENGTWTFYFHETVFVGEGEPQEQITAYTFELTETGCRLGRGDKWLEFTRLDDDIK
ncbi:MAG: choice-of-anchor J domain-containing protein, partial [Clostridia bacterium]|nr:choice-of-anchor J domain-containing protein [Clostridia bacterium]